MIANHCIKELKVLTFAFDKAPNDDDKNTNFD